MIIYETGCSKTFLSGLFVFIYNMTVLFLAYLFLPVFLKQRDFIYLGHNLIAFYLGSSSDTKF